MARADAPSPRRAVRRVALLADDLTGAADAAAPFALRGMRVAVALDGTPPSDVDVLALVTDTRWRSAEDAERCVRAAASLGRAWGPDVLFLKVDSTLRGRVRGDVAAALSAWGAERAVASPAFPAQGRVVRDGALLLHGERTVEDVAGLFPGAVRVHDAESHQDLVRVASAALRDGAVAVGSGGLGRALAEVLVPHVPDVPRGPRWPRADGVLVVVGTTHPVTRSQTDALVDAGAVHVVLAPRGQDDVEKLHDALRRTGTVVLTPAIDERLEGDSAEAVSAAEAVAAVVARVVDERPGLGLVLTGGATALAVAAALGASSMRVLSEAAEGLPLGELVVGDRRVPVVTKSGGFGQQDSLRRAVDALEDCS